MTMTFENLLVLAIVAAAATFLVRRAYTVLAGKARSGCGSCARCPTQESGSGPQVISLESLIASKSRS